MRNSLKWMLVPAVFAVAACGRGDAKSVDDGLKNDLALASQMQSYRSSRSRISDGSLLSNRYDLCSPTFCISYTTKTPRPPHPCLTSPT